MKDEDQRISRGELIGKAVIAPIAIGALAALTARADADPAMTPQAAAYVTHPVGGKKCSGCALYVPAKANPMTAVGTCKLVKGPIAPNGYCKFYQPKAK